MKRLFALAMSLLLLASAALPVFAVDEEDDVGDMDYTGVLDPFTGAPVDSVNESLGTGGDGVVSVANGILFSTDKRRFLYPVPGAGTLCVESDVMTGMLVTGTVNLVIPEGVNCQLYRNGKACENANGVISERGSYVLNYQEGEKVVSLMEFTIVNRLTCKPDRYEMPLGFVVEEVYLNGTEIATGSGEVDLTQEGTYQINYACHLTDSRYSLELVVDRTPPVLALEAVHDSVANGPVDLSDLEPGARCEIELNGSRISYTDTLTKSGNYLVTVTDEAGNSSAYAFTIQVYLNTSAWVFLLLFVGAAAALIIYLMKSRKNLRVR